jgi:hypothetical protein
VYHRVQEMLMVPGTHWLLVASAIPSDLYYEFDTSSNNIRMARSQVPDKVLNELILKFFLNLNSNINSTSIFYF